MKRKIVFYILAILLSILIVVCVWASTGGLPGWFPFNEEGALGEWQEKIFNDKVMYAIETEDTRGHLLAQSVEACSGLIYRMKFDVHKFPMISWFWQVNTFPNKEENDEDIKGWIERDDYAARVYVIFSGWNFLSMKSLEYVWDDELPEGTIITSPYFKNIKLFIIESGRDKMEQWVREERNIYEDFEEAFGYRPPRYVTAIALMTDADNTLSTAEAQYKNLKVGYFHE